MGKIKSKFLTIMMLIFTLSGMFFVVLSERCTAANQAKVSFLGEPSYNLITNIERNGQIIGKTFQINVTLHNSGGLRSEEIGVNLSDEEGFTLNRDGVYLNPGETKTVSFTWSTTANKNQKILVNFYPKNIDALLDEYNSGSVTFTVYTSASNNNVPATSTPGFEVISLLSAFAILIFLLKKRKNA